MTAMSGGAAAQLSSCLSVSSHVKPSRQNPPPCQIPEMIMRNTTVPETQSPRPLTSSVRLRPLSRTLAACFPAFLHSCGLCMYLLPQHTPTRISSLGLRPAATLTAARTPGSGPPRRQLADSPTLRVAASLCLRVAVFCISAVLPAGGMLSVHNQNAASWHQSVS